MTEEIFNNGFDKVNRPNHYDWLIADLKREDLEKTAIVKQE